MEMHNDTYTVTVDRPNSEWEMTHDDSGDVVASGETGFSSEKVLDKYEEDLKSRHDLSESDALNHRMQARDRMVDTFDLRRAKRSVKDTPAPDATIDDFLPDDAIIRYEDIRGE